MVKKNRTRRERIKSYFIRAISKAQKAQNIFLGKNLKFFSFGICRIVPKNVEGGTFWDLLTYIQLQNIKTLEGDTLETLKNFPKKNEKQSKGDPLVSTGFVGYVKKVTKMKGGPFAVNLHWQ